MPASVLLVLLGAEEQAPRQLPMPPILYALLMLGGFLALLGLTWSFRGTAYKVRDRHSHQRGGGVH